MTNFSFTFPYPGNENAINVEGQHVINASKTKELYLLNNDGFILATNLLETNVTGYDDQDVVGKHLSIFYLPEEEGKASDDIAKARRFGQIVYRSRKLKKRRVVFWAKIRIHPIETAAKSECFLMSIADITHRVMSRKRLRTLRDEYLAIFNNPFIATFKFKMTGRAVYMCNARARDILDANDASELYFDDFFSSLADFEKVMSILEKDGKVEEFDFMVRVGPNRREIWATLNARYFQDQGFVEGMLLDVTKQHNHIHELRRVNEDLDNFIYHASHGLRAPLTSTLGLIHLGMRETELRSVHEYLRTIHDCVTRLDFLLKDLIAVSYNNQLKTDVSHFDFEYEVAAMLKLFEKSDPNVKVNFHLYQEQPFSTDPIRMRTILRSLISNSFAYCSDERTAIIDLTARVYEAHCAILLKDNGIGIPHQLKHRIFDLFFRGTDRSVGNGLGLYIVKTMVEKLGGKISFESTVDVGTTFLITIPNRIS